MDINNLQGWAMKKIGKIRSLCDLRLYNTIAATCCKSFFERTAQRRRTRCGSSTYTHKNYWRILSSPTPPLNARCYRWRNDELCVRNLSAGGENDDRSGDDFRHMLAAVSYILHRHLSHAGIDHGAIHTRRVLGVLLASNVQFHA
jgi:hypothetical protein